MGESTSVNFGARVSCGREEDAMEIGDDENNGGNDKEGLLKGMLL